MDAYSPLMTAQAAAFANTAFHCSNRVDNVKAAKVLTKIV
jgi:hypothetical protein